MHSPDGWNLRLSPANARKALNARLETRRARRAAQHDCGCTSRAVPGAVAGKVYTVEPTGDITFAQVYLGSAVVIVSVDPNVAISARRTGLGRVRPGEDASLRR